MSQTKTRKSKKSRAKKKRARKAKKAVKYTYEYPLCEPSPEFMADMEALAAISDEEKKPNVFKRAACATGRGLKKGTIATGRGLKTAAVKTKAKVLEPCGRGGKRLGYFFKDGVKTIGVRTKDFINNVKAGEIMAEELEELEALVNAKSKKEMLEEAEVLRERAELLEATAQLK